MGDLQGAIRSYTRSREFCTTPQHILEMCVGVIEVSSRIELHPVPTRVLRRHFLAQGALEMSNYSFVRNYVTKAESALEALHAPPQGGKPKAPMVNLPGMLAPDRDPLEVAKDKEKSAMIERLTVAGGVASLGLGAYDKAARALTGIGKEALENKEGHFVPPADIALYATLTGLASFDRNELKTRLLENGDLRPMLDLEPHLRDIVRAFHSSHFKEGFEGLETYRVSSP